MRSVLAGLMFAAALPCVAAVQTRSLASDIDTVFGELRQLRPMQRGTRYTLPADGKPVTGANDDFLRRRTAEEIAQSGLSCGCGDYALVFIQRMHDRGYETLLVDSAQISSSSIMYSFSGHAVVAVRERGSANTPWWLVDSTARKVLSRRWSTTERTFVASGHVYWIGYCGPAEDYPARSPRELKQFYAQTLEKVPPEVFNQVLYRFKFTLDDTWLDQNGANLNPNTAKMQTLHDEVLKKYGIKPSVVIPVRVTRGGDDARGDLQFSAEAGWVARVGTKSACSPSYLTYMEQAVRRRLQPAKGKAVE